jgi:hypothetical protein
MYPVMFITVNDRNVAILGAAIQMILMFNQLYAMQKRNKVLETLFAEHENNLAELGDIEKSLSKLSTSIVSSHRNLVCSMESIKTTLDDKYYTYKNVSCAKLLANVTCLYKETVEMVLKKIYARYPQPVINVNSKSIKIAEPPVEIKLLKTCTKFVIPMSMVDPTKLAELVTYCDIVSNSYVCTHKVVHRVVEFFI